MRVLLVILLFTFASGQAEARHARHHHSHHRAHHASVHHSYHRIASSHEEGHALNVVSSAAGQFSGLVSEFRSLGYAIGHPGCLSSGHMRNSKHHWGGACDLFNQIARNVTALRQPPPSVQIEVAARHGLTSGCVWRHPDCGHFEIATRGAYAGSYHRRSRYRHRYASSA